MNDLFSTVNYIALSSHISGATLPPYAFLLLHLTYSYAARTTIHHLSKYRRPRRDSPPMSGALKLLIWQGFKPVCDQSCPQSCPQHSVVNSIRQRAVRQGRRLEGSYQSDVRSRPARRENCQPWFLSQAQKLRGREPDRLDSPRFPGSRYVARALRSDRRGLPGNDLPTEAARGGRLAPSGARTL